MRKYNFDSFFVDVSEYVIEIRCVSIDETESYRLLINAWDNPHMVYYCSGEHPDDIESFENELFAYLKEKYADRGIYG